MNHSVITLSLMSAMVVGCSATPGFDQNLDKLELEKKTVDLDSEKVDIQLPKGMVVDDKLTKKSRAAWKAPKKDGDKAPADLHVTIAVYGGTGLRMMTIGETRDYIKEPHTENFKAEDKFFFSGVSKTGNGIAVRVDEVDHTPLYCEAKVTYDSAVDDAAKKAHLPYLEKICASLKVK